MVVSSSSEMVDHGNYVDTPIIPGVEVAAGQSLRRTIVLGSGGKVPEGFVVRENATLDLVIVVLPGVSESIPVTVDIVGEGANVFLSGIYLCGGSDKVRFDIVMNHRVARCESRQFFNGIAAGESDCGFFGKIVVAPDAQMTEAYQENHNVLLSEGAKVNAKPRLEIYADDVKCSHGATVGKLDEEERFYMRSRGVSEAEAKVLQMISFLSPALARSEDEGLAEKVEAAIRSLAE